MPITRTERYCLPSNTALQTSQPHLEDGSVYRQNRPTQLDKIKNFHIELPIGPIAEDVRLQTRMCSEDILLTGTSAAGSVQNQVAYRATGMAPLRASLLNQTTRLDSGDIYLSRPEDCKMC